MWYLIVSIPDLCTLTYFACALCLFLCQMSHICSKMATVLFPAYFGGHFCYHRNGKSRINSSLLHFGYCANKLIRRNGRKLFLFLSLIWGQNIFLMHVALSAILPKTHVSGTQKNRLDVSFEHTEEMSRNMRFPTMWYVRPAKPQISLRLRAV